VIETTLFNGPYVTQKVLMAHERYTDRTRNELVADPREVSERAEKYVRKLLKNRSVGSSHELTAGSYGGLMVYAIECYGLDYLEIARLATKTTADVVAALSGDGRLDVGPRRREVESRVSAWAPLVQAVKFAEIATEGLQLRRLATPEWLQMTSRWGGPNHDELRAWTEHALTVLAVMSGKQGLGRRLLKPRAAAARLLAELHARTKTRKLAADRRDIAAEAAEDALAFADLKPIRLAAQ
jgi:hypothetical protein